MYRRIGDFLEDWEQERSSTTKLLEALTDASLGQKVSEGGRTLGRLAWHVTTSVGEMMRHSGLPVDAVAEDAPVPATAKEIAETYARDAAALATALDQHWNEAMLDESVAMYGQMWKRGTVLAVLIRHQAHHRGQMTVLMRQAGLPVAGVYGPAKEEWAAFGMPAAE